MYMMVVACPWGDQLRQLGWRESPTKLPIPPNAHVRRFVLPTLKKRNTHLLTPPTHKHAHTRTFKLYNVCWVSDGGVKAPLVSNKSKPGLLWVQYLTFLEAISAVPVLQPQWDRNVSLLLTFISLCCPGTSAQGSPLLASLPVPGRPLQPQLDLKHLLPFRLNGSSPLSLFPNFNTVSAHWHPISWKIATRWTGMLNWNQLLSDFYQQRSLAEPKTAYK